MVDVQCQEDECFVGLLLGAGNARGSVKVAGTPVVVLCSEDECCEPAVTQLVSSVD